MKNPYKCIVWWIHNKSAWSVLSWLFQLNMDSSKLCATIHCCRQGVNYSLATTETNIFISLSLLSYLIGHVLMHKAWFNVSINSEYWMISYNLIPRFTQLSVTCSTENLINSTLDERIVITWNFSTVRHSSLVQIGQQSQKNMQRNQQKTHPLSWCYPGPWNICMAQFLMGAILLSLDPRNGSV